MARQVHRIQSYDGLNMIAELTDIKDEYYNVIPERIYSI